MITREQIEAVNSELKSIDIRGKEYAVVAERVKAFRKIIPGGTISTEIVNMSENEVTMRATVKDEEGRELSTGHANETKGASSINKTSHLENCETSAVGRALGFLGIGVFEDVAGAEEVANAMARQEEIKALSKKIDKQEAAVIRALCQRKGQDPEKLFNIAIETFTAEQAAQAKIALGKLPDV